MSKDKKLLSNFERANVTVLLAMAGDVATSSTEKTGITPPEMTLLRSIHGQDCIRNIRIQDTPKKTKDDEYSDWNDEKRAEYARLVNYYGLGKLKAIWPNITPDADHFKPKFEDYGLTKKHIERSMRGSGALEKLEITEGVIDSVVKSGKMTIDNVVSVIEGMTKKDREAAIEALGKPTEGQALSSLNNK